MSQVTHTFVSPKPDGPDLTLVKPSNWNAQHTITYQIDVISGAASIALSDDVVRLQAGTYAVTVPLATGSGKQIYVFQDGAGAMTLTPSGADTIGGQTSVVLNSTGSSCIICDESPGIWGLVESASGSSGVAARLAGMIWPHGWPVDVNGNPLVSLSYNTGTREVTITALSGSTFTIWWRGVPTTFSSPYTTSAHGAVEGGWFLWWNGTAFTWSQTTWDFYAVNPTTYVYYSSLLATGAAFSELHRWGTDPGYHQDIHFAIGTSLQSGGQLAGYTLNTFTDAALKFSVAQTSINDEDINYVLGPAASGSYTVWYRSGVNGYWEWQTGLSFPFIYTAGSYADLNLFSGGSWGLTSIDGSGGGNYGTAYVVTTPALLAANQFIIIPGQTQYSTLAAAQAETFQALSLGSIPFIEFVAIAQIVFYAHHGSGGTTNTAIAAVAALTGSRASVTIPISNTTTLALAYSNGSTSAQQTMSLLDSKGGGIIVNGTEVGFTGASAFQVQGANSSVVNFPTPGGLTVTTGAIAGATPTAFTVTGGAYTTMVTTVEDNDVNINLSATKTWATGAIALQRDVLIQARTYAFAGASTVTTAVTLAITNAPQAGANATITNPFAFGIEAGKSFFNGEVGIGYNGTALPSAGGAVILAISAPYQSDPSQGATLGNINLSVTGGNNANLSIGIDASGNAWFQCQPANSSSTYPIFINPAGGATAINYDGSTTNESLIISSFIFSTSASWNLFRIASPTFEYTGAAHTSTSLNMMTVGSATLVSSNAWTITDYYALSVSAAPVSSGNVTITRNWCAYFAGNVKIAGSQQWKTTVVNVSSYSVLAPTNSSAGDFILQVTYTPTGLVTINLPQLSAVQSGFMLIIVDSGYKAASHSITITPATGDKIDNGANKIINVNGGSVIMDADTTNGNWEIIAGNSVT
jgi:hypothetical protein